MDFFSPAVFDLGWQTSVCSYQQHICRFYSVLEPLNLVLTLGPCCKYMMLAVKHVAWTARAIVVHCTWGVRQYKVSTAWRGVGKGVALGSVRVNSFSILASWLQWPSLHVSCPTSSSPLSENLHWLCQTPLPPPLLSVRIGSFFLKNTYPPRRVLSSSDCV